MGAAEIMPGIVLANRPDPGGGPRPRRHDRVRPDVFGIRPPKDYDRTDGLLTAAAR